MTKREQLEREAREAEAQWRLTFRGGDTTERLRRWRELDAARARVRGHA